MPLRDDPSLRFGMMLIGFVAFSLTMVGIFFSHPPPREYLKRSSGTIETLTSADDSLNFTLKGWDHPLHYDHQCGGARELTAALASAQQTGASVSVEYQDWVIYHKSPEGVAYDAYAVSVPGRFERSYLQCEQNWIVHNRNSVYIALGFLAAFGLLQLIFWLAGKR